MLHAGHVASVACCILHIACYISFVAFAAHVA
jgi:hypothetical protein